MSNINSNFIEFLNQHDICVPIIQRDYVQGSDLYASKRDEFIDSLLSAISEESGHCELDFIYGSVKGGQFMALDGQQRLTTLYMLHWYLIARYNNLDSDKTEKLEVISTWNSHKLNYETRLSSSVFCSKIKELNKIDDTEKVSDVIKDQSWFSDDWLLDPSIVSMLQFLDVLAVKINELINRGKDIKCMLQQLLETNSINFDQLNMGVYKLTDSLYVKMNGRGKQLTDFENWKAKFIQLLENKYNTISYDLYDEERKDYSSSLKEYFTHSIEHEWTDLFWHYSVADYKANKAEFEKLPEDEKRKQTLPCPLIDSYFTSYYDYIMRMCYYEQTKDAEPNVNFTDKLKWKIIANEDTVKFLFWSLDFFAKLSASSDGLYGFFDQFLYISSEDTDIVNSHTRIFVDDDASTSTDLFKMLINNQCSVSNQIILFLLLKFCKKNNTYSLTPEVKQFVRWCRNYLENKNQRLAKDMKMHLNVRLNELAGYIKDAGNYIENPAQLRCDLEDEKFIGIENSEYLHGYLGAFDLQTHGDEIINVFKAFRSASDIVKVRLLIAYGFRGANWGWSAHGARYFFGKGGRWDTLFRHAETAKSLRPIWNSIAVDYKDCDNLEQLIAQKLSALEEQTTYNFAYYMLKYDSFAESSVKWINNGNGCHFFAMESDYDVISIPRFNSRPLIGYHTDPYACAVARYFAKKRPDCYLNINYTGMNRDKAKISYKDVDVMYFTKEGLEVLDNEAFVSIAISPNEDRIQIAIDKLSELIQKL
jgi:hypothetical protein